MALQKKTKQGRDNGPSYELRAKVLKGGEMALEIWQLPSLTTSRLKRPEKLSALKNRVLKIVEVKVFRRLKAAGIRLQNFEKKKTARYPLDEDTALNLSLLFRVLAPMRNIDRIRVVGQGVDEMNREEAGYWLGMAVHRSNPRRVLAALRLLLTTT